MRVVFPITVSSNSWTVTFPTTHAASTATWSWGNDRSGAPSRRWHDLETRLVRTSQEQHTPEGRQAWQGALRDALAHLREQAQGSAPVGTLIDQVQGLAGQLWDHGALWSVLALRAMTGTAQARERLLAWLERAPAPAASRVTRWAYDYPGVARRLGADARFWRTTGQDAYSLWGRVLDDPVMHLERSWKHLDHADQRAVEGRSAALRRMVVLARAQVQRVRAMEDSGLLQREANAPWVHRWLRTAVEWGSLARLRAVLDAGTRLDAVPGYCAREMLTEVIRGVFFDLDDQNDPKGVRNPFERSLRFSWEPAGLERRKSQVWARLTQAGLPAPDLRDLDPEKVGRGEGNGAVWRQVVQRQGWCTATVLPFLVLQLKGWCEEDADGLSPLDWAMRHGARTADWTPTAVIEALRRTHPRAPGPAVDALLEALVRVGACWRHRDRTDDGMVAHALRSGASDLGLQHLVRLRADFLWTGSRGESVLMRTLATGIRWPMVEALLQRTVQRHGAKGRGLLQHLDQEGASAVHWAARALNDGCVQGLIQRGLDAGARDLQGRTAVHWAARQASVAKRHPHVLVRLVQRLIAAGADPTLVHARGRSGLDELVRRAPPAALVPLLQPYAARLTDEGPDGRWIDRLRERGEPVAEARATLELHHTAEGAMLDRARPVRAFRRL